MSTASVPELQVVIDALTSTRQPRSVLGWLRRSDGREILQQLARGEVPLTHDGLDALGRSKPADHVRGLLMATALLPDVDIHYERLGSWLEDVLVDAPESHARLVRPFAVWQVFRRARRKADAGGFTESGAKWARLRVRQALAFLDWLDDHGQVLAGAAQSDVDLWLASGATTRYAVRDFLRWASARGIVGSLEVPLRQVLSPATATDDDERWEQVEWLLSDDGLDRALRVAGLLALLYGQHLSRVVRLQHDHVTVQERSVTLLLGTDDVELPPRLDRLVADLRSAAGHATITRGAWLFPGGTPGRHVTAEHLRQRPAVLGLVLRPTRQAALLQLAAQLPAPVLADLLGLHPNTAVEWVRAARGDWSAYAAVGPVSS